MPERTVAIVGRPNVGKSALFNRLAGRRISIVHDMPGVTRDRISAKCKLGNEPFNMLDTGGIGSEVDASFTDQVHAEVEIALAASDLLLFVVDGQDGLTPVDQELARRLRKIDKPLILVVNKIDHDKHTVHAAEFSRLGFKAQLSISAEHNLGIGPLVAWIERELPGYGSSPAGPEPDQKPLKIAIVGRPNVGKSSLTNAILHDDRTMVSPISGTTRDAIDIPYERHGHKYVLIDTAGIRPRGKVDSSVEVFSVMRSESSIRRSDICCLVIDATMGVTAQDKKIAGLIQEASRPCVIAVNKWDLIKERTDGKEALKEVIDEMRAELFFLDYAPLMLVSAKTGAELTRLFKAFENIHRGASARIGTGVLNRLIQNAVTVHPPPSVSGKRLKILFATQPEPQRIDSIPIPEIVLFVNNDQLLAENYRRHLESKIREHTPYTGLPLRLHLRARESRDSRDSRDTRIKTGPAKPRSRSGRPVTHPTKRREPVGPDRAKRSPSRSR